MIHLDKCDICDEIYTIKHLSMWELVEMIKCKISYDDA